MRLLISAFGSGILLAMFASNILIQHLAAGTVPPALRRLAATWIRSERDPKWINVALWALFWVSACLFLAGMGTALYEAALDLGKPFNQPTQQVRLRSQ